MLQRTSRARSVALILTGLMLGMMMVAPAFGNHAPKHTKKQIKRLAQRIANVSTTVDEAKSQLATQIAGLDAKFEPIGTTQSFGPVPMGVGAPTTLLFTSAPFSVTATCTSEDFFGNGPPFEIVGRVLLSTAEPNSAMAADPGSEDDFDPSDPAKILSEDGHLPGVQEISSSGDIEWHAAAPSGVSLYGKSTVLVNFGGSACRFVGTVERAT